MKHQIQADTDLLKKLVEAKYQDNVKVRFAFALGVSEATVTRMLAGHVPSEPIRNMAAVILETDVGRLYRSKKAA